ncbi:enoyl-CoA hydratase/isomerase family protein [Actinomadura sp. KC345]|uniref:enoyl-CoA hydratase/isomerase family protein n=1 Tax=Actinomadura sp. KC345 TaxID=2530371 RepID=UPI00104F47DC|nr:enoyl-CoA hydratase-related protein [Actinomadura sp. KC345]TDC57437.1 enoyl-CoA hydratase/isomerase family protein [Actinomadura sp. KC345]
MASVVRVGRERPGIAVVTLARPDSLNALDAGLMAELYDRFGELGRDPDVRAVILTGEGRAFSAGLDVRDFGGPVPSPDEGPEALLGFQRYMSGIIAVVRELPQPVIAAVNGAAVGGGMALACASDIRIATPSAKFGAGAIRIGLSGCEMGLSYHLPRLVGMNAAADWMLTGRLVGADEAHARGLVGPLVEPEELIGAAVETAASIIANAPFGVRMTKRVMWANADEDDLRAALDREDRAQVMAAGTVDAAEARAAFLERRPPRYLDR